MASTNDFSAELQLIASTGDQISPDAELELAVAQLSSDTPNPPAPEEVIPFGRGWAFDFDAGRFMRYGSAPARVDGLDQLRMWIQKTILTPRFAAAIYEDAYGTESVDVIGSQYDPGALADLAAAITEALLVHDRITSIEDFAFDPPDPMDDYVVASFTVITDADPLAITIPVTAGG